MDGSEKTRGIEGKRSHGEAITNYLTRTKLN
jgi:hypothetical protein